MAYTQGPSSSICCRALGDSCAIWGGVDINAQDQSSWTLLHVASYHGALEFLCLLLKHGADVEVKDNVGETALQQATDGGDDEAMELL
jgi:ankyrin repeat protein